MRLLVLLFGSLFLLSPAQAEEAGSAYDFTFPSLLGGEPIALSQYRGKVLMIVNTASECGFTPQYAGLESLYQKYRDRGFVVIGVPSNDFGGQEPGEAKNIATFCRLNYGVSFPMAAKQTVSGGEAHPFYRWARQLGFGTAPKWNFHKYLIDRQGRLVDYFSSTTPPDAGRVTEAVEKALAR